MSIKYKIIYISVHPDDETLGCGGTILRTTDWGYDVYWLNITSHNLEDSENTQHNRDNIIAKVGDVYNFKEIINFKYPDQHLDTVSLLSIISEISNTFQKIKPDIIFIPNRSDVHSDHRISFDSIIAASKNFRAPFTKGIYMYETLSETEFAPALAENAFIPNTFVDITDYIDKKIEIMKLYDTEIMPDPLPRSVHAIKGLAAFRGSRIGVRFAEAFMCIFQRF